MGIIISIVKGLGDVFFKYWKQILVIALVSLALFFLWSYQKEIESQKLEIQTLQKSINEYKELIKQNEFEIELITTAYSELSVINKDSEVQREKNRKTIIKYRTIRKEVEKECGKCPDIYTPIWDRVNELFDFDTSKADD